MIFTERTITVVNDSATINKPLILYRGDKNIELKITIAESQFKFRNTDASNVIETTDASYAQLVINTPYNSPIFSDVAVTKNGAVIFVITEAMIDEIREVGAYEIQIRLLDDNKQSRASIPPVSNAIEIREPIAIEDGSAVDSNAVNVAKVNRALTTTSAPLEAFDSQGNYIKKTWGDGDPITDAALNKMEAGIDGVNKKIANNSSQIKEKADNSDLDVERKRIDNIVKLEQGSTTGDAELIDARIGANGFVYGSLGDSIRGQFRNINNIIGLDNMTMLYDGVEKSLTSSNGSSGSIYLLGGTYDTTNKYLTGLKIKVASECEYKIYIFSVVSEGETTTKVNLYKIITMNLTSGVNYITLNEKLPNKIRIGISGENNTIIYGNNGSGSTFFVQTTTSNWPSEGTEGFLAKSGTKIDFSISIYVTDNSKNKIEVLENKIEQLENTTKLSKLYGKKILLFGDSRSSSDYTWYKDKLEEKTGATVLNKGKSGATPKSMIDEGYLDEMLNVEHDICIMFLCGNISGYKKSLGTFTWGSPLQIWGEDVVDRCSDLDTFNTTTYSKPIQQIDYIIQKYNNKYYSDRKHKLYVLTDIPSKRQGESHGYRMVCNFGKSEMIKEVCEQNEVAYIDTMRKCGFNEDFEPEYIPPTDTTTNNGVYYMDGLHLNEFGFDVLTDIICKDIL